MQLRVLEMRRQSRKAAELLAEDLKCIANRNHPPLRLVMARCLPTDKATVGLSNEGAERRCRPRCTLRRAMGTK